MYSREQVKAFTDKIFNMSGATDIEVNFSSSERSGTRFCWRRWLRRKTLP